MSMAEPNWFEQQYYPSLSIAHVDAIFESWKARAAATRAKLKFIPDIHYGPHRREVMDFFPAENARGCLVFIHGGYWLGFSKFETSWVAKGFVGLGLSVALINYPLCPEVSIGAINASCLKAFAHLYKNVLSDEERKVIVVSGHSAGGYLAAAHLAHDWAAVGLPADPIAGVLTLSGVFDVAPLMHTDMNAELQITDASARVLNLNTQALRSKAKLALAVGEHESIEFHRQSSSLAVSWPGSAPRVFDVAGTNHFTIVDSLAAPGAELNRLALAMAGS
jgi:arylformamidase